MTLFLYQFFGGEEMRISTGIIRRVDELGRIVIPKEMRKVLDINQKDPVEITIEGSSIIIRKYENRCVFCGAIKPAIKHNDKLMCTKCLKEINKNYEENK